MAAVGCLLEEIKEDVEKVLTYVQRYMTLERFAGREGACVTILGNMKEPEQSHLSSLLGWTARKQLALKLKYPKLDMSTWPATVKWFLAKAMHKCETVREAQALMEILPY